MSLFGKIGIKLIQTSIELKIIGNDAKVVLFQE